MIVCAVIFLGSSYHATPFQIIIHNFRIFANKCFCRFDIALKLPHKPCGHIAVGGIGHISVSRILSD